MTFIIQPSQIRAEFKRRSLEERAAAGEFREVIKAWKERTPTPDDRRARQETVEWWSKRGELIAIVHRWKDAEGNLAASGKHDPKWLGGDRIALAAADAGRNIVQLHDYRKLLGANIEVVIRGWRVGSQPLWGMRCANCGRYWIELLDLENGARFHTEACCLDRLLAEN